MGWLRLPSEKGATLNEAEGEQLFAWFRAPVSKTISPADVLTVEGTGRYTVLPNSGVIDQITSIVVSQENLNGAFIELATQTVGHTITLVHGTNLRLAGGINVDLTTPNSTIWLRYRGANLFVQASVLLYVP